MEITREQFDTQRHRRFGTTNPERMENEFWHYMVRTKIYPLQIKAALGLSKDEFYERNPVWCFGHRMGMTHTQLPDGREIYIAGEYEDFYDPDFCIYNDVIVFKPDGRVEIYGYPQKIFPPTDFHSATLVGNAIYIVGSIGYGEWRDHVLKHRKPFTPVFRLDCETMQIEEVATTGDAPSWLCKQVATFNAAENAIDFTFGETWWLEGEQHQIKRNTDVYRLDLTTLRWSKIGVTKMKAALFDTKNERITIWHGNVLTPEDEENLSAQRANAYHYDLYDWSDSDGNRLTSESLGMDCLNYSDYFQRKLPAELHGLAQKALEAGDLDEESQKGLQQLLAELQKHLEIWDDAGSSWKDGCSVSEPASVTVTVI